MVEKIYAFDPYQFVEDPQLGFVVFVVFLVQASYQSIEQNSIKKEEKNEEKNKERIFQHEDKYGNLFGKITLDYVPFWFY